MDLSIVIVNWNSAAFLMKCLRTVYETTKDVALETIVVDNASYDGSGETIKSEFPMVRFIQSEDNLGFSGANNLGYVHSQGRNLLFLNPDTEILGDAIARMLDALDTLQKAGAIGCRLLNSDMTVQTSCVQAFPTILNQALDSDVLRLMFPKSKLWKMDPLYCNSDNPSEVEVVSGACIMVKKSVFDLVGHFSTDYFMYAEDIALCYKIRQAGYNVYFIKDASVVHHGGGSSAKHDERSFGAIQMRESIFRFLRRTKGKYYAFLYKACMSVVSVCRLVLICIIAPVMTLWGRRKVATSSFHKWSGILRWSLGLERWVR